MSLRDLLASRGNLFLCHIEASQKAEISLLWIATLALLARNDKKHIIILSVSEISLFLEPVEILRLFSKASV